MRCEIWVEGNLLDLNEDLDMKLSYLINDVRNFTDRETAFSKTIVIPGTAQNNFIFGSLFDVKVSNTYNSSNANVGYNYNAAKSAQAIIYVDKMQVFKGVIRVLEIVIDRSFVEYECSVYGELGGLVFVIGEKYLSELDFSAYDHTYNTTNIAASWTASAGSGYYYPLCDYGITDIDNIPFSNLRPALYAKEYLDKIFTDAGYTYDSAFLTGAFFKNHIIPNNSDQLWIETEKLFYWQHPEFSSLPVNIVASPHVVTYVSSIGTQYLTQAGGSITFNRSVEASVRLYTEVKLNLTNGSGVSQTAFIRLYKNGVDTGVNAGTTVTAGATVTPTLIFESIQQMVDGDVFNVRVTLSSDAAFSTKQVVSALFYGGGNPVVRISTEIGDTIQVNTTIPRDIKQKDFLSSIVKMYNLYIYEDTGKDKHVKIEPYSTFYASGFTNKKDWSNKLDRGLPIRIKPLGELTAKSYQFKYKDDSDFYNEVYKKKYGVAYGQRVYDTGLEMVKEQVKVELIFAPPVMVQYSSDDKVLPALYKSDGIVKQSYVSVPRILLRKSATTSCGSWNVKDGSTTLATYTEYPYAGHLDDPTTPTVDIMYGAPNEVFFSLSADYPTTNLFNDYYSSYVSEISNKDSKLLNGMFKLSALDIMSLDFGAFIFIDGTLYRLNKIEDYDGINNSVCKCELLTVIDY